MQYNENTTSNQPLAYGNVPQQKIISTHKFITLNIFSFGFYQLCWMFQAWRFFLQKDHLDIKIAARTGFAIFYLYPLFLKIHNYRFQKHKKYDTRSLIMYLAIVLTCILPQTLFYISIFGFVFLIPAFKQLNEAKKNDPSILTVELTHFSAGHKTIIVIGSILWVLILFSIFLALLNHNETL